MTDDAHLLARAAEKQNAVADLSLAIGVLEKSGREPDDWERACLAHGLIALYSGLYVSARQEARLALTPLAERSPAYPVTIDPALAGCTLVMLKRSLAEAEAEPVRQFPRFGPVVMVHP